MIPNRAKEVRLVSLRARHLETVIANREQIRRKPRRNLTELVPSQEARASARCHLQDLVAGGRLTAGMEPVNAMEQFFEEYYGNDFMADRFQSMTIDPSRSTRVTPVELRQ